MRKKIYSHMKTTKMLARHPTYTHQLWLGGRLDVPLSIPQFPKGGGRPPSDEPAVPRRDDGGGATSGQCSHLPPAKKRRGEYKEARGKEKVGTRLVGR